MFRTPAHSRFATRSRVLVALLGLVASAVLGAPAHALTLKSLSAAISPSKTDKLLINGSFDALALEDAQVVVLRTEGFAAEVAVTSLTRKRDRLSYRGPKDGHGFAALSIDLAKRRFKATVKNVALSGLGNPLLLHFGTDVATECVVATLADARLKPKKKPVPLGRTRGGMKLAKATPPRGCGSLGTPVLSPNSLTVGETATVKATVAVEAPAVPDGDALTLVRLDSKGARVAPSLCTLRDDGGPASGDVVAGDGTYTCQTTLTESAVAAIPVTAVGTFGGIERIAPGAILRVGVPLTDAEIDRMFALQAQILTIWEAQRALHGNSLRARIETVRLIRTLDGIAAAGLSRGGLHIDVWYASGLEGGLHLNELTPPSPATLTTARSAAGVVAPASSGARVAPGASLGADAFAARGAPGLVPRANGACDPGDRTVLENRKVLIWDPGFFDFVPLPLTLPATWGPPIRDVLEASQCPSFDGEITTLSGAAASVASLATFGSYGTIVLVTHGSEDHFLTGQEATASQVLERRDLEGTKGRAFDGLAIKAVESSTFGAPRKNLWVVAPRTAPAGFFGDLTGTIFFAGYCGSGEGGTPAQMRAHGIDTYFGYSGLKTNAQFLRETAIKLFTGLVTRQSATGPSWLDVEPKTDTGVFGFFVSNVSLIATGDPTMAYLGNAVLEAEDHEDTVDLTARVDGARESSDSCDFTYRWKNTADHGHLTGQGGTDEFDSTGTPSPPKDEATYTADSSSDSGIDMVDVEILPAGGAAGGSDDTRFGKACRTIGVSNCGNDQLDGTEECDGDADTACPDRCMDDCTCSECGDGAIDPGEECDGNDAPTCPGSCGGQCTCVVCGNGRLDGGEECDLGHDDKCPNGCLGDCTCTDCTPGDPNACGAVRCCDPGTLRCCVPSAGLDDPPCSFVMAGCCGMSEFGLPPNFCGGPNSPTQCPLASCQDPTYTLYACITCDQKLIERWCDLSYHCTPP